MKKDIEYIEVTDVAIAIVPNDPYNPQSDCEIYFINYKPVTIENVLVNVTAEGVIKGEQKQTSTLRFFLHDIPPNGAVKFEYLVSETHALTNRYWVSFYENGAIQDKKFILHPNSLNEDDFEIILPLIQPGLLLR